MKSTMLLLLVALVFASCVKEQKTPNFQMPQRIVDLSPTVTEDLPVRMVGHKLLSNLGVRDRNKFEHIEGSEPMYYLDSYITLFNHAGPHVDAPIHLIENGSSVDKYDLERFIGYAKIMDFSNRTSEEAITVKDIQKYDIRAGDIAIAYVGYIPPVNPEELPTHSVLSREAAEYLARLPVKAFATDSPGVDNVGSLTRMLEEGITGVENLLPVHYAFLSRRIPIIETLVNLNVIAGEKKVVFVGFPLKTSGKAGDAGPMRAVALIY
jgi:kynurenine formamidase